MRVEKVLGKQKYKQINYNLYLVLDSLPKNDLVS